MYIYNMLIYISSEQDNAIIVNLEKQEAVWGRRCKNGLIPMQHLKQEVMRTNYVYARTLNMMPVGGMLKNLSDSNGRLGLTVLCVCDDNGNGI